MYDLLRIQNQCCKYLKVSPDFVLQSWNIFEGIENDLDASRWQENHLFHGKVEKVEILFFQDIFLIFYCHKIDFPAISRTKKHFLCLQKQFRIQEKDQEMILHTHNIDLRFVETPTHYFLIQNKYRPHIVSESKMSTVPKLKKLSAGSFWVADHPVRVIPSVVL